MNVFKSFDKLVFNGRIGKYGLHQLAEFGRNQLAGFQQVVKAGHLQGSGAVGKIVKRIPFPGRRFGIVFADPQTAVFFGVIQAVAGRLQQLGQIIHSDAMKDLSCRRVGRITDHQLEFFKRFVIEIHFAACDFFKGTQENGNFWQASGVHHLIRINVSHPGRGSIGDIDYDNAELFTRGRILEVKRI